MKKIYLILMVFLLIPSYTVSSQQVEFKRELSSGLIGSFSDIATNPEGHIYIADSKKKMIHVLEYDGREVGFWGGKTKTKAWHMENPSGIAFHEDKVYVTDSGADMVFIFSKDGKYIDSFGEGGSRPKEFSNPKGTCIFRDAIYVADSGNQRIQVFSLDGIYMGSIGGKDMLEKPKDVAVDHRGYIYVADAENVKVFKPEGMLEATYHVVKEPSSIIVNKSGFYVADNFSYSVKGFDFNGNPIFSFGTEGKEKAQFKHISGISLDPAGNIFVSDSKKGSIQIFFVKPASIRVEDVPLPTTLRWSDEIRVKADRILWDGISKLYGISLNDNSIFIMENNIIKKTFKGEGEKKNTWNKPSGMALELDTSGAIWLADTGNDRIIKVNTDDGRITSVIGSRGSKSGYFSKPMDIAISQEGIIYVADTGNKRVQTFGRDGIFLSSIGEGKELLEEPVALALDLLSNIYVVDRKAQKMFIFTPAGNLIKSIGSEGELAGQFKEPADIFVTKTEVFVLDSGNQRVQVFDHKGNFKRQFGAGGKGKGDFGKASSMTKKDSTQIYVSDPELERIQLFSTIYTPSSPSSLKAGAGMHEVILTWDENPEEFIDHYKVIRSDNRIDFKEIAIVNTSSFTDTTMQPEKTYYYTVSAVALRGNESKKSNTVDAMCSKYVPSAVSWYSATPNERDVTITWQASKEPFVTSYALYKEEEGTFKLLEKLFTTSYIDKKVTPSTTYTYRLTAISSDDVESDAVTIKATTLKQTKPPVEIVVSSIKGVFSNSYKIYETEPIGTLNLTNNTWEGISKLKVSFMIKDFMDYPTEKEVENLKPWAVIGIPINAVFNNKLLELTENTSLQAEIKVSYYENKEPQVYTISQSVPLYERHHLLWDDRERIATFITPKDPLVLEFAREVARQYADISPDPIIYARALFDAFGIIGISYIPDPNNPYQVTSEKVDQVDYIQYPRETLSRKSGDCDDLVNLYSSTLESLGVETNLIDVPGHIFMMFSTGMDKSVIESDTLKDMFIIHKETAWIPVEVTLIGDSFMNAWKEGVSYYNEWKDKGLMIIDLKNAWQRYKPSTLPPSPWRAEKVKRAEIEAKFGDELEQIKTMRVRFQSRKYLNALYEDPSDVNALIQLGIIYSGSNLEKASEFFKKVLTLEPQNASAMNNLANTYFLVGKYAEAKDLYEDASAIEPNDPHILVNIARCYLKLKMKKDAKEAFDRAYQLDRNIPQLYRNIAFQLSDPSFLFLKEKK